ncbi:MAG: RNA polymerase sigma factor [Planctomycetota bacterium]
MSSVDDHGQISPDDVVALYHELSDRLRRLALGVLRDQGLADEVLQTVFGKLLEHEQSIRDDVRGWLFRVALNEAMQIRRRQSRHQRAVDQVAWNQPKGGDAGSEVEGSLVREETVADVRRAIEQLPENQRQVVRMRIYENRKFVEIANELDIPIGTVLTRMRLATERLQQALRKTQD